MLAQEEKEMVEKAEDKGSLPRGRGRGGGSGSFNERALLSGTREGVL